MFEKTRVCSDFCNIFAQMAISDIEGWFESDNNLVHNDIAINYDLKFQTDLSKKIADKLSRKYNIKIDHNAFEIGFSPLFQSGGN